MCRGAPSRVTRAEGDVAWIDQPAGPVSISLLGIDDVQAGDYVFHHAGLALQRLEPEEAETILAALAELEALQ